MSTTSRAVPGPLLALLDVLDEAPSAVELRSRSYELLHIAPGTRLLDVGCGGGRAVGEAARLGAVATGVDPDERMIAAARARWRAGAFVVADACALPYPDGSVDAYRADKVFHELVDPSAAVAEARRVLAPRGRIVLIGQDWDTFVVDADDAALTRRIVHARADQVTGPRVARRYRGLLLDAGFREVETEIRTGVFADGSMLPVLSGIAAAARAAGAVSPAEAESWTVDQHRRAAEDRSFVAVPMFVTAATR
ncbi:methyltransferase domain-containing protein [Streptomyces sp. NBC_01353]|uniref:methyltransferase domain-containing protein n=1 Tax=Streptomyces sp. NBC_01353 TaxID=2903835 RepID=UPI002E309498|nr:methyltransferase domain-containing protein [Streptomyces sp. NBC_01353]